MRNFFNPFIISDLVFGTSIFQFYRVYRKEEKLSRSGISDIQNQKLRKLLVHAISEIPFYKNLNVKFDPNLPAINQLAKFPILNKLQINNQLDNFHIPIANWKKISTLYSGGSSGRPGKVFINKDDHSKIRSLILILWENAGYKLGDPILQLGMSKSRSLLKRLKDYSMNVTYELAFQINKESVYKVLSKKRFLPNTCFIGYASGLYSYAKNAEELGLDVKFKLVISLGDKMFDHYRETIERVFKTKVYDTYGSNEGFVVGGQHNDGHYYLNETHVIVEIVDDNYLPVKEGEVGRALINQGIENNQIFRGTNCKCN